MSESVPLPDSPRVCIACDGQSFAEYGGGLVSCDRCHLVVAADVPSDAELAELYQQDYFFGQEYFDYEADRPALEANFRRRIAHYAPLFTATDRIVEIGCAYGYFLHLVKDDVAWHRGYDVSQEGVAFAVDTLGVQASNADFLTDPIAEQSVDTVVMWDVVEHVPRPHEFFERAAYVLRPGGSVVLTTGDISSRLARWRGPQWRMIHPPTHIYYFDPLNLAAVMARYGLVVVSVRHPGVSRNAGSVLNQLLLNARARGRSGTVLALAERVARRTGLSRLNVPLNTFDIMEVRAVKR